MANGFKVFAVGEVLTAANVNDYLMEQSISIFANSTARDAQITSPIEGMFCYLADSNVLQFYNGSSWASYIGEGDITGVTITTASNSGLAGGATASSGAFSATMTTDLNNLSAGAVNVANDSIAIVDADDSNATKKEAIADLISGVASSGLAATSGTLKVDVNGQSSVTAAAADEIMIADASDSNNLKKVTVQSILDQGGFADIGLIIALG